MTTNQLPTLARIFEEAGNVLIETTPGYRTSHRPVHESESCESLHISAYGHWKCWSCQEQGGLVNAVMSLHGLGTEKAAESWLKEHYPLSVRRLAEDKGLPDALLSRLGLDDLDVGVVSIPYRDIHGQVLSVKRRTAYTARLGSRWPAHTPLMVYGLEHLQRAKELGYLVLVEGESDTWTLLHHGFPVLGVPGATGWGALKASHLDGIATIYIWQEFGASGTTFVKGVEKRLDVLGWDGQATVIRHSQAKDPNVLHKWDPQDFRQVFQDLLQGAERIQPGNVWKRAKPAPVFLAEPDNGFEGLAKDLLSRGSITLVASPRGLGKSVVALAVAVALATGGMFRGEPIKPVNVLLVDRDNPEPIIKERLRAWGAAHAPKLRVLTRADAPSLTDRDTWASFPVEDYDVLIIDAVGSATEGVTEKEGKQTTEVLATLLDLSHRGLAVLMLQNVIKDGSVIRGRGEWMDRSDIVYEARDATGFVPSLTREWWTELPDAAEGAWAARAARRKGRCDFRLAFVVSKYRLGIWPAPFCLELNLPHGGPWTLADVTETLQHEAEAAKAQAIQAHQATVDAAAHALFMQVKKREQEGTPLLKTEAEAFLCKEQQLKRQEARTLITWQDQKLWQIISGISRGGRPGLVLIPTQDDVAPEGASDGTSEIENPPISTSSEDGDTPSPTPLTEDTCVGGEKSQVRETMSRNSLEAELSAALGTSERQKVRPSSPCGATLREGETFGRQPTPSLNHSHPVTKMPPDDHPRDDQDDLSDTSTLSSEVPTPSSTKKTPKKATALMVEVGPTYDPGPYTYIKEATTLEKLLPAILEAPEVGLDIETTGLSHIRDRPRLVQLATPEHTVIVDTFHIPVEMLAPLMHGNRVLYGDNLKFEVKFLTQAGLAYPTCHLFDTMIASLLLEANDIDPKKGMYTLEAIAKRYLNQMLDKRWQKGPWDGELSENQLKYAACDAAIMFQLVPLLQGAIANAQLEQIMTLEMSCLPALAWLEHAGIGVDAAAWMGLSAQVEARKPTLEVELHTLTEPYVQEKRNGKPINWRSPPQVLAVLHDRGIAVDNTRTATLLPFTDDPVVERFLQWRPLEKRSSSFGEHWVADYFHAETGRVYANFKQLGSRAGRMSCTEPNLQQIPKEIGYRHCFSAPKGSALVGGDYSQIELRILAHLTQELALLDAFRRQADVHRLTAAKLFDVPYEAVTPEQRAKAKTINFGVIYGMGHIGLAARTGYTEDQAKAFLEMYFATYKKVNQYKHEQLSRARQTGEVRTLLGRRRLLTRIHDRDDPEWYKVRNMTVNTPVQGSAADAFKLALVRLFTHRDEVPGVRLVNLIHDEIVAECPVEHVEATKAWLITHMVAAMDDMVRGGVPIEVNPRVGQSWAGSEERSYSDPTK